MVEKGKPQLVILLFAVRCAAGCATGAPPIDPETACHIVRDNRAQVVRAGTADLAILARGTPVASQAKSAYAQQLTATVFGGIGIAALVAGFVSGFATDPATQPEARNAAYGLGGGAIAAFATTLVLGFTARNTAERARARLKWWSERCP